MRRVTMLAAVGSVLLLAFAGAALAAVITCPGGRCEGTNDPDEITGSEMRDRIFALDGGDFVQARGGRDELNGGDGDDSMRGDEGDDTYFGGRGADFLDEEDAIVSDDVVNGGQDGDEFISGGGGDDVLRGQLGSEQPLDFPQGKNMFGDTGDDELFGGEGNDGLEGEEDTDELFGGDGNDFLDAATDDSPEDPRDLVDCGAGTDQALVRPNDRVRANCEDVTEVTAAIAADPGTGDEEQQQ